jgi:hypothetical protein
MYVDVSKHRACVLVDLIVVDVVQMSDLPSQQDETLEPTQEEVFCFCMELKSKKVVKNDDCW